MFAPREMPRKPLADLLGRLAVALSAGIGLRRAWQMEVTRASPGWRPALEGVARAIAQGVPLAEAMASSAVFPPFVHAMVAVGESTGHEAETLREISQLLEQEVRAGRALRRALAGPALQFAMAVAVMGFLIFMAGFMQHDVLGLGLRGIRGLVLFGLALAAAAVAFRLLLAVSRASWRRHGVVRVIIGKTPVIGPACRAAEAAAWCRVAALSSAVGLDAGRLVSLSSGAAPGLAVDPRSLEQRLRSGATLAEAIDRTGRFPNRLVESIAVGEATGNTAEVLDRLAAEYQDEARAGMELAVKIAGFLVWAAVAAIVVMLVLRIFSTYVGAIQRAAGGR